MKTAGPFTGEPGYELLYWLPFLRSRGFPETAITRGGAGIWYPCKTLDAYELIGHDTYKELFAQRFGITRVEKSFGPSDVLDAAILRVAKTGDDILHPAEMYQRLQDADQWRFEPFEKPAPLEGLDPGYIAVRLYESYQLRRGACLPGLKGSQRIVALQPDSQIDNHAEHKIPDAENITKITYGPDESLETVSRVVAYADAFICTYGGLSYLGPHYGVPTLALHQQSPPICHYLQEQRMVEQLKADYEMKRV